MRTSRTEHAHLGIDVSKARLDAALLTPAAAGRQRGFANTAAGHSALRRWAARHAAGRPVDVCVEATGTYHEAVAEHACGWAARVAVANPRCVKAFLAHRLPRAKTDRADALGIARFSRERAGELPAWEPPTPARRELRELSRRLDAVVRQRAAEKVRLGCARPGSLVAGDIARHIGELGAHAARLERAMAEAVRAEADLLRSHRLLVGIKGVGARTACLLLAEIGDHRRFAGARQLAAHSGLTPAIAQSGTSLDRRGGICRIGSSRLRSALYFPAMVAMRHNPAVRDFAERLAARGKPGKAVVVACMRKLLHIAFGVLNSGRPFDPSYHLERKKNPCV